MSDVDIYIVRVERLTEDGESEPVCEGEIHVPDSEDIISIDDLCHAIKAHDLCEGGDEWMQ